MLIKVEKHDIFSVDMHNEHTVEREFVVSLQLIVGVILIIGAVFAATFHILVKEKNNYTSLGVSPPSPTPCRASQDPEVSSCDADALPCPAVVDAPPHFRMKAMDWLKETQVRDIRAVTF